MKRTKFASAALLLCLAPAAFAGQALVVGNGSVQAPPDCATVEISVTSECYPSALAASNATDKMSRKIFDFLTAIQDPADSLSSNGGFTQSFVRFVTDSAGRSAQTCHGTFQKMTTIIMNVRNLKGFEAKFARMQEKVFADFQPPKGNTESAPITFATIGAPTPELFPEHKKQMEMKARRLAVENAIKLFEATKPKQCEITNYRIAEINDNIASRAPTYSNVRAKPSSSASTAPVMFETQTVDTNVNVKIEFDGGHCL
ncbi:MAG: SIMPL domain-containing protein [Myxococcota bacterium]